MAEHEFAHPIEKFTIIEELIQHHNILKSHSGPEMYMCGYPGI